MIDYRAVKTTNFIAFTIHGKNMGFGNTCKNFCLRCRGSDEYNAVSTRNGKIAGADRTIKKHNISSCEHKESAAMQRRSLNLIFFAQPILLQDQKKSTCAMQMLS